MVRLGLNVLHTKPQSLANKPFYLLIRRFILLTVAAEALWWQNCCVISNETRVCEKEKGRERCGRAAVHTDDLGAQSAAVSRTLRLHITHHEPKHSVYASCLRLWVASSQHRKQMVHKFHQKQGQKCPHLTMIKKNIHKYFLSVHGYIYI